MMSSNFEIGVRWGLALLVLVFGANGVFRFFKTPPFPPAAEKFRSALLETHYMLPCWKTVELIAALLLLTNKWTPFALILLAPVLINIFLFHLFLSKKGLPLATALLTLESLLAWQNQEAFTPLFK